MIHFFHLCRFSQINSSSVWERQSLQQEQETDATWQSLQTKIAKQAQNVKHAKEPAKKNGKTTGADIGNQVFQIVYLIFVCRRSKTNIWGSTRIKTDIKKSPFQSIEKTSLSTVSNSFISAYDSTAQDLAARIHQKWPLLDQKWEFYDTTLIHWNPENDWPWHCPTTYLKAKKGDISP